MHKNLKTIEICKVTDYSIIAMGKTEQYLVKNKNKFHIWL